MRPAKNQTLPESVQHLNRVGFENTIQQRQGYDNCSSVYSLSLFHVIPVSVILIGLAMFTLLSQVAWVPYDVVQATATYNAVSAKKETQNNDSQSTETDKGKNTIAPLFTPEVRYWQKEIINWSKQYDLNPNLVATVMQIESCGNPQATSPAGAMGLFQVMPYHFEANENPYDPNTNAKRGLSYLKRAYQKWNQDALMAFAGYNGGLTGAERPRSQWHNETKRYVYWGEGIYNDALKGKESSERLDEWLAAGGASLCREASKLLGLKP